MASQKKLSLGADCADEFCGIADILRRCLRHQIKIIFESLDAVGGEA